VFHRRRWFSGRSILGDDEREIAWFRPDGSEMTGDDWHSSFGKAVCVVLNGQAIPYPGNRGEPVTDDAFVLIFNAHYEPIEWTLPPGFCAAWAIEIDTAVGEPGHDTDDRVVKAGEHITVADRSMLVLRAHDLATIPTDRRTR
jgi:isoamylase